MEKITGDEQAMPCQGNNQYYGLTIRQHFAAMAMQGLLCNPISSYEGTVKMAVEHADLLITELNKPR